MINFVKFLSVIFCLVIFSKKSFAYLEPGSIMFIIQSIIAGIVGVFVTIGLYWTKFRMYISSTFSKIFKSKKKNNR